MPGSRIAAFTAIVLTTALSGCSQGSEGPPSKAGAAGAEGQAADPAPVSPFYVDPSQQPAVWAKEHAKDPRAARIQQSIAQQPTARWFGDWSGAITPAVSAYVGSAERAKKTPVMVAFNITDRDCKGNSSGGAGSPAKYRSWISQFATAVGRRPAVVVVEPDSVAQLDCLPAAARKTRTALLEYAVQQFKAKAPEANVYLDGGNANWIAPADMAQRLDAAGIRNVRGFALNVSNYYTTAQSAAYAEKVNATLNSKYGYTRTFVVDTSRNGNGSKGGEYCNPAGRKLGVAPRMGGGAEMLLWIKVPGESDGPCGAGGKTKAGDFSPDLAVGLIDGR